MERDVLDCTLLVVDDQEANVRLVERLLGKEGYRSIHSLQDPRQVLERFLEIRPDLLILDLKMPHLDGFEVMALLREELGEESAFFPVLIMTADITAETKLRALAVKAADFVTKPFDAKEFVLRVHKLLEARVLHQDLRSQQEQLTIMQVEMLRRMAAAAEYHMADAGRHVQAVGITAQVLASRLGVPRRYCEMIGMAAQLHDVGKMVIPERILFKPGPLTTEEYSLVKTHAMHGANILGGSSIPLLQLAEEIARTHHERHDGRGYPMGLAGDAIPIAGRIVAVADVFDALRRDRVYKKAWSEAQARSAIVQGAGSHFDPAVVEAFDAGQAEILEALASAPLL
ncbi:MAG: response regulator [Thermaerobacter sp.]|nr:response regulator [Thermaerobacter sp.]